jgi:hypothetical protein
MLIARCKKKVFITERSMLVPLASTDSAEWGLTSQSERDAVRFPSDERIHQATIFKAPQLTFLPRQEKKKLINAFSPTDVLETQWQATQKPSRNAIILEFFFFSQSPKFCNSEEGLLMHQLCKRKKFFFQPSLSPKNNFIYKSKVRNIFFCFSAKSAKSKLHLFFF